MIEDKMKNKDIFRYYLYQKELGGEYTAKYDKYRKKSESCGKSIQSAEKFFNVLKKLNQGIECKTLDAQIINYYKKEHNKLFVEQLNFLNEKEHYMINQMIECPENYQYNQKWHLIIGYYLYSAITGSVDWNREINPWKPKGRMLSDILLYIWMIEAAGLELPREMKEKIDSIERLECKHANTKMDRELRKIFTTSNTEGLTSELKDKVETFINQV